VIPVVAMRAELLLSAADSPTRCAVLSHLGDRLTRSARYQVLESRADLITGALATIAVGARAEDIAHFDTIIQALSRLYRRLRSPRPGGHSTSDT
jgi:hypothetical protein